jgi:polyisoprenoid-binding protein YceI
LKEETMKLTGILSVAFLAGALAFPARAADTYNIDRGHSDVGFQVIHLGLSKVRGQFKDFAGKIVVDPAKPEASSVELTINTGSVDTGNEGRDKDLRSAAGFLEVGTFPTMTFKSSKITAKAKDLYEVSGTLTLHGVAKPLTLSVKVAGPINDPWGNVKVAFETQTTLNRKDYGLTWNKLLDNGGLVVSDDVDVSISLEAAKAKEPAAN